MASPSAMAIARLRTEAVVKEMENKQNMMRLKWFEENYEKVYKDPALPKEKIPKKAAVLYEELRKMRKERFNADKKLRTKQLEECKIEEKEKSLEIMYPVPLEVKRVLYEGVSHDDEGRKKYLKMRYKEDPHDKFYQKITSAFEYGWKIQERRPAPLKAHCRRNTWHYRVNGALNVDDPLRRPPNTPGHITIPIL